MPINSREVMILVFFQNFGKWCGLPVPELARGECVEGAEAGEYYVSSE
jgi:hypothetical protein